MKKEEWKGCVLMEVWMKETRAEERRSRKRERADSVYGRCQFYTSHVPKGVPFTLYFPRKSEEIFSSFLSW